MAHFKLIPIDSPLDCIEFDALSIATVLDRTLRRKLGETDIYQDGPYRCTVSHGDGGVWTITQRKTAPGYGGGSCRPASASVRPKADLEALFSPQLEMA